MMLEIAPIERRFTVKPDPARSFAVFTERMVDWVPPEHSLLDAPRKQVIIEPYVGGRWYEIGEDGTECSWGRVAEWTPPERMVLIWQLSSDFVFDPSLHTEVIVEFAAAKNGGTDVRFTHRGLDAYGDASAEMAEKLDGPTAWSHWIAGLKALIG